jgi:hypothetical protein
LATYWQKSSLRVNFLLGVFIIGIFEEYLRNEGGVFLINKVETAHLLKMQFFLIIDIYCHL